MLQHYKLRTNTNCILMHKMIWKEDSGLGVHFRLMVHICHDKHKIDLVLIILQMMEMCLSVQLKIGLLIPWYDLCYTMCNADNHTRHEL